MEKIFALNSIKDKMLKVIDSYNFDTSECETRIVLYTNIPSLNNFDGENYENLIYLIDWDNETASWMVDSNEENFAVHSSETLLKWFEKWLEIPNAIKKVAWESI